MSKIIDGDKFIWLMTRKQLKRIMKNYQRYGWRQITAQCEWKERYGKSYKEGK